MYRRSADWPGVPADQTVGWKDPRTSARQAVPLHPLRVDKPALPPYAWFVEHVVLPNFTFFGWLTLLTDAAGGCSPPRPVAVWEWTACCGPSGWLVAKPTGWAGTRRPCLRWPASGSACWPSDSPTRSPAPHEGLSQRASLIPEITITADGVCWHPVAADHDDQLLTREIFPLSPVVAEVRRRRVEHRNRADAAARRSPCA